MLRVLLFGVLLGVVFQVVVSAYAAWIYMDFFDYYYARNESGISYSRIDLCRGIWYMLRHDCELTRWQAFWLFSEGARYIYQAAKTVFSED